MLKALQTRKKLKDARDALDAVMAKREELQTREAELETAIEQSLPEDEARIDADIEELENDKTENDAEVKRLQGIIDELEKEIESEPKPEQAKETEQRERTKPMELRERENAYVKAFAEYIKTGKDTQCRAMLDDDMELRALLTQNVASGTVPVPAFVYDIVKTAWDREDLTRRVRKSYLAGNVKIGFEISGDDAVIHTEGSGEVTEEDLDLGIVELKPETIKKWVSISDEVADLGEEFLRYVYEEITYKIAKKLADALVAKIVASPRTSSATAPAVPVLTKDPALDTIFKAVALLSDEATNPVIIAHKSTIATFKGIQASAPYAQNIFDGYEIVENNSLDAFDRASSGDVYMIVGDLGNGALLNFPKGAEAVQFKYDDLTLATSDLIKIIGRLPVGYGVIAPNHFVNVKKA